MSYSHNSSDPEWKEVNMKIGNAIVKRERSSSLNKIKYCQRFCEKWLNIFSPWLARCEDDANKPFCRACQCKLDCNRCHLQRHERTGKHQRNLEILTSKGEGAARQNLSIRQERSKYYQQRKKMITSASASQDFSDNGIDTTEEDGDYGDGFHFVHTEASESYNYADEPVLKQETISRDGDYDSPKVELKSKTRSSGVIKKNAPVKKERMKLLMQIQKNKNDLMDSFKELMGNQIPPQLPQSTPKEKNHIDLFFESVSSSVQALTPKLIAEAKMRVSQLICELELRGLTDADSNSTSTVPAGTSVVVSSVGNSYIVNQPIVHSNGAQDQSNEQFESLS